MSGIPIRDKDLPYPPDRGRDIPVLLESLRGLFAIGELRVRELLEWVRTQDDYINNGQLLDLRDLVRAISHRLDQIDPPRHSD